MSDNVLNQVWSQLQKAETDLMGAIRSQQPNIGRLVLGDFNLSNYDLMLFFRLASGFDIHNLSAHSYLRRYPFSSVQAIDEKLAHYTDLGFLTFKENDSYQLSEAGKQIPQHYWAQISAETDRLNLMNISIANLDVPFGMLQHILANMQQSKHPSDIFIFSQRMQGFHPDYAPPALWHLWQYVWSMLAFEDDIRLWRSQKLDVAPLTWHYFYELQDRVQTVEGLHRRTLRYAPVPQLEIASQRAIEDLHQRGWIEATEGPEGIIYALSEAGQATAKTEEELIDREFLGAWPELCSADLEQLEDFLSRLNMDLDRIIAAGQT